MIIERRDQVLMTFLVLGFVRSDHLAKQVLVDEGALLETAWHLLHSYLRFLPALRRRTMSLSLSLFGRRVRPSFCPRG